MLRFQWIVDDSASSLQQYGLSGSVLVVSLRLKVGASGLWSVEDARLGSLSGGSSGSMMFPSAVFTPACRMTFFAEMVLSEAIKAPTAA